jgi:hypothetical protein
MKYSLYLSLLLLSPLFARENPFFASDEAKKQKVTSNISDARPQMGTINYTFADQARVLKEVTFTIQNLDGSIEEKKLQIDQSIDWHRALTLSQSGASARSVAANSSSAANFGFLQLYSKGKTLTIKTSDPLVRHFALSSPNSIVIDFKHEASFNSDQKTLNAAPYMNVSLGNHGKFARATITLDGHYAYTLSKENGLISITCK